MTELWVPPTAQIDHELDSQLERLGRRHEWLKYFDRELQAMDPRLSLVKASESATETGLKPGFWHIKRDNEQTMATYYPLQGEDAYAGKITTRMQLGVRRRNSHAALTGLT